MAKARRTQGRDDALLEEVRLAAGFRRALLAFLAETDAVATAHRLTARQYTLLLAIKAAPDERMTVTDAQEFLSLGQSGTSELVERAEAAGLVERRRAETDARYRCIVLTPEGERRFLAAFADLRRHRQELARGFARADELLRELVVASAAQLDRS